MDTRGLFLAGPADRARVRRGRSSDQTTRAGMDPLRDSRRLQRDQRAHRPHPFISADVDDGERGAWPSVRLDTLLLHRAKRWSRPSRDRGRLSISMVSQPEEVSCSSVTGPDGHDGYRPGPLGYNAT